MSLLLRWWWWGLLCPCGFKQSTLTEIRVVVAASWRATPSFEKFRQKKKKKKLEKLEGEQCRRDVLFANACVFPVMSCWSVRVWVCVMEADNTLCLALLCHPFSVAISPSFSPGAFSQLYLALAREEPATTGIWAHRAALIRRGLVPCATTACERSVCV